MHRALRRRLGLPALAALLLMVGLGLPAMAQTAPVPASTSTAPPTTLPPTTAPAPTSTTGPTAGPTTTQPGRSGTSSPGLFDFAGRIRQAVNSWFRDLVVSALNPLLDLLGRSVLATPDLTAPGSRTRELWWASAGLANSSFVLFVLVGGALVVGHETIQTDYAAKEIAPRLAVAFIAANASLLLAGQAITLANAISRAVLGQGLDPTHVTGQLKQLALAPLDVGEPFLIWLAAVVAVLALVIVGSYVVRVALTIFLIAAAPLALICHALPQTDGVAQLWWRAFAACLGVQVGQALALVAALRVFFGTDRASVLGLGASGQLIDLVVVACLFWILARLPVWAARAVFGHRRSMVVRMVRGYVIYRVIRGAAAAVGRGG